jgi:hypothetical protein
MAPKKDVDALYGLPLEEFTSARNKLADELRSRGEREEGDRVAALVKPTTAAWAVNQVMRTQRKDARALLEAGERLRKAHQAAASRNASASDLREAVDAERAAVVPLTKAARGLPNTRGRGLSESILERVTQTLHALSSDSEARSLAGAGRLSQERQATGAGAFDVAPSKTRRRKAGPGNVAQVRKTRERLERAQREARELRSRRTRAARATSSAEQALARAREDMRDADRRVAEKEAEIEELRRTLEQLK